MSIYKSIWLFWLHETYLVNWNSLNNQLFEDVYLVECLGDISPLLLGETSTFLLGSTNKWTQDWEGNATENSYIFCSITKKHVIVRLVLYSGVICIFSPEGLTHYSGGYSTY